MRNFSNVILSLPWHRRVFYLLVLLLPLGGRLRFAREASMLYGQIGEFIIPELYLSDILIGLLLITWSSHLARKREVVRLPVPFRYFFYCLVALLLAGALAVTSAVLPWVSLYRLLKLCEWGLLVLYIVSTDWKRKDFAVLAGCLVLGGAGQSLLAWYQFSAQASLTTGFLAHAIGEQPLSLWQKGISFVWALGQKWMRPYGTFSHPNALSGYFLVTLIAGAALWLAAQRQRISQRTLILLTIGVTLIAGGIGIALSRVVWFLAAASAGLVFVLFPSTIGRYVRDHVLYPLRISALALRAVALAAGTVAVVLVSGGIYLMFIRIGTLWSSNQITVTGRILLNSFAMRMMELHPLGIGPGNFTVVVREFDSTGYFNSVIQPVHNVFLLIGSEMGVLAMLAFIALVVIALRSVIIGLAHSRDTVWTTIGIALFLMLSCSTAILFLDHYLWTIQQGQLIWWMVCGFCLKYSSLAGDAHGKARTR